MLLHHLQHYSSLSSFILLSTHRERGKEKARERESEREREDTKSTSLLFLSPLLRGRSLHLIHQSSARMKWMETIVAGIILINTVINKLLDFLWWQLKKKYIYKSIYKSVFIFLEIFFILIESRDVCFSQCYLTAVRTYFTRWLIRMNSYNLTRMILYDLSKPQWQVGLGAGVGVGHSYKFIRIGNS